MAETVVRKRGWVIQRNWDYDRNDPTSKYYGVDEDTWRDGILEEWTELAQEKNVDWCHFIFHDRDKLKDKDTGAITIKKIHAHAVVRFKNPRAQNGVMQDWCGSNQRSENCQWADPQQGGFRSALLYLTHHTTSAYNAEKTWYHYDDIQQFGKRYLDLIKTDSRDRKNKQDVENTVNEFVEKIMNGDFPLVVAKQQFKELEGASALVKYKAQFDSAFDEFRRFKTKELQKLSDAGLFNKWTTYISGASQTGKSALASCLAVQRVGADSVFTSASGGSKRITTDFVDGYETEKATIFNDLKPNEYDDRAFYNMFDPNKWSLTKSRNTNKPWLSTYCYIATALPFGEFLIQLLTDGQFVSMSMSKENASLIKQGFRRVQQLLTYGVNDFGDSVVWVGRLKNNIPNEDEIIDYAKKHLSNRFDGRLVGIFYDVIGYVPYDKNITKTKPFHDERMRIAEIINAVYDGNLNANGFVKI